MDGSLSIRNLNAVSAMRNATHRKPVLPEPYVFRRDAAEYLVRHGLAKYRGFDGISSGGYWLTADGKAVLRRM